VGSESKTNSTKGWATTSRRGRALIEHWFDAGWGGLEPGVVDEVCAPAVVADLPVGRCIGAQTLKDLMKEVGLGLLELEYSVDVIGSGHEFAASYSLSGYHRRSMFGAPATDTRVTLRGLATYHVQGGKIVEFAQTAAVTSGRLPIGALHVPPEVYATLTDRERALLSLMIRGDSHKIIADQLGLAPSSVDKYARQLQRRLGVRSRTELVETTGAIQLG